MSSIPSSPKAAHASSLKVIGAGWGRTGTASLRQALNILELGPCFHMIELFQGTPESHRLAVEWNKVKSCNGVDVDWDVIFQNYQSAVDFPASCYYKQLMERYPSAKVILTVRDPLAWWKSAHDTILPAGFQMKGFFESIGCTVLGLNVFLQVAKTWTSVVAEDPSVDLKDLDRDHVLQRYTQWNEEVKQHVPEDKLLVFEVKDGWAPLCKFLQLPIPPVPFPRVNDAAEFKARMSTKKRATKTIGIVTVAVATSAIALGVWKIVHEVQKQQKLR